EYQAALLGLPIVIPRQTEATLAGVAAAAGEAAGCRINLETGVARVVRAGRRARESAALRHAAWRRLVDLAKEWK
ncbi:MAG TPA: hypothetical protein VFG76_12790, partial [Candidatus Polarisedimenticolia bacterium]|nr:hypothetical protein [Candidatus Polarisedimenticolia bacterium]